MAECRRSHRENKGKKRRWEANTGSIPTPASLSPKSATGSPVLDGGRKRRSISRNPSPSPSTHQRAGATGTGESPSINTNAPRRADAESIKIISRAHQNGKFSCRYALSPQSGPSVEHGHYLSRQTYFRSNPLGRLRPPYRPPLIEHEIASHPPYTRDERLPTTSPSFSASLLQPRYQPVPRGSSPVSVHSDSTIEWDISVSADYDTQATSAGALSTEKHVTPSAVVPSQTNRQGHGTMAQNTRSRQSDTPKSQQDHLSVTSSTAGTSERSKTKTKQAADINASFKKAEADLDAALGRKGPPSNKAGKKVWDKYLEDAMTHLGARSLERNRWEQLEALEAEQTRMRGETFHIVGTEADEVDDAEILMPNRTKNLRQRKVPVMPPPATMDSPRRNINGTGARHNFQKLSPIQLPTIDIDVPEVLSDAKPTKAKQPRDEQPDTDKKQSSAKKKRLTEDLSSSLGAAWDAHVDMAGHRPRRTSDKLQP